MGLLSQQTFVLTQNPNTAGCALSQLDGLAFTQSGVVSVVLREATDNVFAVRRETSGPNLDRFWSFDVAGDLVNPLADILLPHSDPNSSHNIVLSATGNEAFIMRRTSFTFRITSIDISNPAAPAVISTLDITAQFPSGIQDIVRIGDVLWVCGGIRNLSAIDISNPAAMAVLASYNTEVGFADGQELLSLINTVGSTLCLFSQGDGGANPPRVGCYDATDPLATTQLGTVDLQAGQLLAPFFHMPVTLNTVHLVSDDVWFQVDVTDPANPVLLSANGLSSGTTQGSGDSASNITIFCFFDGVSVQLLRSYDTTNETTPHLDSTFNTDFAPFNLRVNSDASRIYVVLNDGTFDLGVLEIFGNSCPV